MIVFVDSENKVRAVNVTTDNSLTPLYVDENNDTFPFKGWSVAKICCYRVSVSEGVVVMMTPYVDSNVISHIDQLGNQVEAIAPFERVEKASVGETQVTFVGVPEGATLTTVVKDLEGNFIDHHAEKLEDIIKVFFEPLQYAADIYLKVN